MYRVMIVDDESWIRKGIKAQIEWERLGLIADTEAEDGVEALEIAQYRMPDILIADVRMPGMDGLELAEKMLEQNPGLKVLIISGYSEFEYVKASIQLPAISYILKPIDAEELNRMLEKAVERLELESIEESVIRYLPDLLEKHAADLCNGSGNEATASSFLEAIHFRKMEGEYFACALFHYDDTQYDVDSMSSLLEKASASLPMGEQRFILWGRNSARLSAIVLGKDRLDIHAFIKNLLLALGKENISDVWVAVGDPVEKDEVNLLSRSHREALDMSERYALTRRESIIPYTPEETEQAVFQYPLHLQKKVLDALVRNDQTGAKTAVHEIAQFFMQTQGATLRHARSFFLSVVTDIVKNILSQHVFHEGMVDKGFEFCLKIDTYDDLQRMAHWLERYLQELIHVQESANQRDVYRNILAAAEYIREHYHEEISLNSISTRYFITSSYFSSMFKAVMGENFLEYLTRIRMEKAKELLGSTDLKVGQISEMVGYGDSRYFSKLFKKHTGRMPTEYRQSLADDGQEGDL